jgi:hypothetical protein
MHEIGAALESGAVCARKWLAAGSIDGAALRLHGDIVLVAARTAGMMEQRTPLHTAELETMHA